MHLLGEHQQSCLQATTRASVRVIEQERLRGSIHLGEQRALGRGERRRLPPGSIDDGLAPAAYPEVHQVTSPLRKASAAADDPRLMALWAGTGWQDAADVPAAVVVRRIAGDV